MGLAISRARLALPAAAMNAIAWGRLQRPDAFEGQELGVARADAQADQTSAACHLRAASCVTGMAGRQTSWPPIISARASPSRSRRPPCAAWNASNAASPATVTAFTTSRPPCANRCQQYSISPGMAAPPPTKIAVGFRQVGQRRRRLADAHDQLRDAKLLGVGTDSLRGQHRARSRSPASRDPTAATRWRRCRRRLRHPAAVRRRRVRGPPG